MCGPVLLQSRMFLEVSINTAALLWMYAKQGEEMHVAFYVSPLCDVLMEK